ncbi:MAG: BolA family transcriptional regulator [Gammaproteobacteria bacterium]|nr:BolA family transcriptional regulator [Gammaproteobacteria bacterium]MDH5692995.1 BolA family transcriptional regulator [Gammaproteobacteria bacterium]
MSTNRVELIHDTLTKELEADSVEVIDESHLHVGHAGARDGKGHFKVIVVAQCFEGKKLLQRHQMVYQALAEAMQTDIHALSISAKSISEV